MHCELTPVWWMNVLLANGKPCVTSGSTTVICLVASVVSFPK